MGDKLEGASSIFKTGQIHTTRDPKVHVPPEVSAERLKAISFTNSLTSSILGDPVPWRSALGKREKS